MQLMRQELMEVGMQISTQAGNTGDVAWPFGIPSLPREGRGYPQALYFTELSGVHRELRASS